MATTDTGAALSADGVDLVNEYDTGRMFPRLFEEIPHTGGAHADKHFHEIGTTDGEERDTGLTGDRLGKQGFARSRWADQQDTLGDPSAQPAKLLRVLQEVNDLTHFFFHFVDAGHVIKGDFALVGLQQTRAGFSKTQRPIGSALHLTHKGNE